MRLLSVLAALAALPLHAAEPKQITCKDGRVVTDTRSGPLGPFQPDPCYVAPDDKLTQEDLEFLLVYGPPPQPTGRSLADRIARVQYEQDRKGFRGMLPPPAEYEKVAPVFGAWNMGDPVFFATRYGQYVRFTEAPFKPCQASMTTATLGPAVVVAVCQVDVIQDGFCVPMTHPFLPGFIKERNSANCSIEEPAQ